MSGDLGDISGAVGDLVTGSAAARAVEPDHGGAALTKNAGGSCLNCGADPLGNFCQSCGQKVQVRRTLSALGHDLIHGVLHLDGKFWRTLPLLTLKPGQLTRRYIDGERAKFVSPMAMFLFGVFAMFAVFQIVGLSVPSDIEGSEGIAQGMASAEKEIRGQVVDLEKQLAELEPGDPEKERLDEELVQARAALNGVTTGKSFTGAMARDPDFKVTGFDALDKGIIKKWQQNPGLMLYKLQANAYKFSWLLIPISVPFVWLIFAFRRQFRAYDHAIFVTYSISFVSLLFITASLIAASPIGGPWVFAAVVLIPPIHLYKQLRGTYRLGRFGALWRLLALSVFIWIIIILFLQALLLLGAF